MFYTLNSYGQNDQNAQLMALSKQYFVSNQSESRDRAFSNLVIDDNTNTSTLVNNQNGINWWQLNMKFVRNIAGVKVNASSSIGQFYVFISKAPFNHTNLNSLLQDPWVKYSFVSSLTSEIISLSGLCQYIMILPVNGNAFSLYEVTPYGYPFENPNVPHIGPPDIIGPPLGPPYGICGPWWWPPNNPPVCPVMPPYIIGPPFIGPDTPDGPVVSWWGGAEICGDGIDNDFNGLTDCEDYPCGVGWFNVVETMPTCPICNDGQICIYSYPPVTQVSINGGNTWTNVISPTGETCFSNLPIGTYEIVLKTSAECTDGETIKLEAPKGAHEDCFNGGFEEGNFDAWTGGLGENYSINFNNTSFDLNNRHTIIQNSFIDPYVPFIQGFGGTYTTKLGNDINGSKTERLTYCFKVDNDNKDFSFNYAAVLQTPDHNGGEPFFQYRIFKKSNNQNIDFKKSSTTDPFLTTVPFDFNNNGVCEGAILEEVKALGWQCVDADLSNMVGQEVCAEFITADCAPGCHFGYGYIDGLCSTQTYVPDVHMHTNDVYCFDQPINVQIEGVGFNQFRWTISKINATGIEFDVFATPITIGFAASIDDVKLFYESKSGFTMPCPQTIKIKFEAFSDCGSTTIEKNVSYSCASYPTNYCDPLIYCISSNQNQIQIQGQNDCTNCTYEWSSKNVSGTLGMIDRFSKYPTLDRSIAFNAFDKVYDVAIKSPEGCMYNDRFTATPGFDISIDNIDYGYCSYKVYGSISFEVPVSSNLITATAINTLDNTSFPLVLSGSGNVKTFDFTILRNTLTRYKIVVNLNATTCVLGNCEKSILLDPVNAPFHSQWKASWPNAFSPNGDGNEDFFSLNLKSVKENMTSCQDMNSEKSSVFSYKLEIFDRWGNLIFTQTVSVPLFNTIGILGPEIKWDGTFNGTPVVPGLYTFTATIESCYDGSNQCTDCGSNQAYQKCADAGNMVFAASVTVAI